MMTDAIVGVPLEEVQRVDPEPDLIRVRVEQVKSFDEALALADSNKEVTRYLSTSAGIEVLQRTLDFRLKQWRLTPEPPPPARDLNDYYKLYNDYYLTEEIFSKRDNWLELLHRYNDYVTLQKVVRLHREELREEEVVFIRNNLGRYPLTVFFDLWQDIGEIEDLVPIFEDRTLSTRQKESYVLPILHQVRLSEEEAMTLLRVSLLKLPRAFKILFVRENDLALRVLEEEIPIERDIELHELELIAESLEISLSKTEANNTILAFAERLLLERMSPDYNRDEREVSWNFFVNHSDEKKDMLSKLREYENFENRLWLRQKL